MSERDAAEPSVSPSSHDVEARRLLEGITPGEWSTRIDHRAWDESVHYMIGTTDGKRFIAFMCGSLGQATRNQWNDAQKQSGGWRDDPAIKADAEFIAAAPRLLRAFLAERETLKADGWCDACAGKGEPFPGTPCMCGGTGRASMAVIHLRERLVTAEAELSTLRASLAAAEEEKATTGTGKEPESSDSPKET